MVACVVSALTQMQSDAGTVAWVIACRLPGIIALIQHLFPASIQRKYIDNEWEAIKREVEGLQSATNLRVTLATPLLLARSIFLVAFWIRRSMVLLLKGRARAGAPTLWSDQTELGIAA